MINSNINKRKIGGEYERRALLFLEGKGLTVLETNYRCKVGEIDLICKDGSTYVFVEVKYRKNNSMGDPAEAVNYRKQKTICKVATYYMVAKKLPYDGSFRFDVVSILGDKITWYKNAFMYIN